MQTQIGALLPVAPDAPCDVEPRTRIGCSPRGAPGSTPTTPDVVVYLARGETFDSGRGKWQNLGQAGFDRYVESRFRQAVAVSVPGASVVLMTSPSTTVGVAGRRPVARGRSGPGAIDNATMREVAGSTPAGADGSRVYVCTSRRGLARSDLRGQRRPGQRALQRRRALHALGRIYVGLRLAPELAAIGQAHAAASPGGAWPGSATIDPLMVSSLPAVVRRADDRDVDAMAAQMAKTFWDDPVSSSIFRNGARRDAGCARTSAPSFGPTTSLRRLLHDRRLRRLGHLGPAGKPFADRLAGDHDDVPVLPYVVTNLVTTLRLLNTSRRCTHEPHWYLASLGTRSASRAGSGERSDASRALALRPGKDPCYSSPPRSATSLLRRHGFEVVQEVPLARRAVDLDDVAEPQPGP